MSSGRTTYYLPFDIEILKDNARIGDGAYLNRGKNNAYVARNKHNVYCLPNISYKFSIDDALAHARDEYYSGDNARFEKYVDDHEDLQEKWSTNALWPGPNNISDQSVQDISKSQFGREHWKMYGVYESSRVLAKSTFNSIFSKDYIVWDFGDGTTTQDFRPVHTYNEPGEYEITVTVFDTEGQPVRNPYSYTLTIHNFCADEIAWDSEDFREFGIQYVYTGMFSKPLTVKRVNSWQDPDKYSTLTLYASGSDSIPADPSSYITNKHAHFQKLWRFVDNVIDPVPINKIHIPGQQLYGDMKFAPISGDENNPVSIELDIFTPKDLSQVSRDTVYLGISGQTDIFYIDDTAKNYLSRDTQPVFLFISPQQFDSINVLQDSYETDVSVLPAKVYYAPATDIQLTTNGIESFKLQKNKYVDSINTLNISTIALSGATRAMTSVNSVTDETIQTINNKSLILKSDYKQLSLSQSASKSSDLAPFEVRVFIEDYIPVIDPDSGLETGEYKTVFPSLELSERQIELPITQGAGNFIFIPKEETSPDAKLIAEAHVVDPVYCPTDTEVMFVINPLSNQAHFISTRTNTGVNVSEGAAKYTTLADGTLSGQNLQITDDMEASIVQHTLPLSAHDPFPVCVDQLSNIYVGDTSRDTIIKFDKNGNVLNNEALIYVSELICQSNIIESKFNTPDVEVLGMLYQADESFDDSDWSSGLDLNASDSTCSSFRTSVSEQNALAPSSIACDGTGDIWVTLIDGIFTVKIHYDQSSENYQVTAIATPVISGSDTVSDNGLSVLLKQTATGERLYMPTQVETDKNNNIWVSYTNPEKTMLVKYDTNGVELTRLEFDDGTSLDSLLVDTGNDLWVTNSTCLREDNKTHGSIIRVSVDNAGKAYIVKDVHVYNKENGTPGYFDKPSQMIFDMEDNLYIAHAGNELIRMNPATYKANHIMNVGGKWSNEYGFSKAGGEVQAIEGLSCDSDNKILVVNNKDRKLYVIDPEKDPVEIYYTHDLRQYSKDATEKWGVDMDIKDIYSEQELRQSVSNNFYYLKYKELTKDGFETLMSPGDWTGIRWTQKYSKSGMGKRILRAETPIHVQSVNYNDVQKINEDFDATQNTVNITLQDNINKNTNLMHWFFQSILGDVDSPPETIGKTVYEKISNFVGNNSDIDTCDVDSLYSMATELGFDMKQYLYTYPGSIKRLIDLFSINYSRLAGTRNQTDIQFTKNGYANNFNHGRNLGDIINHTCAPNPDSSLDPYIVKVGTRLVAKELYNGTYTLIEPMAILGSEFDDNYSVKHGGLVEYPLCSYSRDWGWGLSHPSDEPDNKVFLYYDFYQYKNNNEYTEILEQMTGVIDWDNPLTQLDEKVTDKSEWVKPGGIIDSIIDRKLRKGMDLFINE